jgi:hypothetical protein
VRIRRRLDNPGSRAVALSACVLPICHPFGELSIFKSVTTVFNSNHDLARDESANSVLYRRIVYGVLQAKCLADLPSCG